MSGDAHTDRRFRTMILRSVAPPFPMSAGPRQTDRAGTWDNLLATTAIALALLVVALLPRVTGLSDFYTTDEAYFWQGRVARFSAAIAMGDWVGTNQTGHPGVTTMWLGTLGKLLADRSGAPAPGPGGGAIYLSYLRLPLGVANALAVSIGYLFLLRLVRPRVALIAAVLWATSPFLIAHSRLLHLDGLLTSLNSLSLLALLVATLGVRAREPARPLWRRPALLLSGLFAGLALLTKSPALLLLPFAGGLLFCVELWGRRPLRAPLVRAASGALAHACVAFLAWLSAAAVVFVGIWPAMWVHPLGALGAIVGEVIGNGGKAHSAGNYFMGQAVADPGWPFYLAVVRWRGEPPMALGLLALAAYGVWRLLSYRAVVAARARRGLGPDEIRQIQVIVAWAPSSCSF